MRSAAVKYWVMFLLVFGVGFSVTKTPAQTDAALVSEYFVRQGVDEPLVIRVNPFEAEFRVRVSAPNGEVLREAELPGNRTLPLLLYIDAVSKDRQLDIRIEAPWQTGQTRFELEYSRLDIRDDLSERLARAYQLLAFGQEILSNDTAANWSVKVNMLMQASKMFEEFGMEELKLWAGLAAAHLAHFKLGDANTALALIARAMEAARTSGLADVALSALMLQGQVLMASTTGGDTDPQARGHSQAVLEAAATMAAGLGFEYERAYAHYLLGQEWSERERYEEALLQYETGLDIALKRQAIELATDIRERMVEAHDQLGDVVASEEVLGSVVRELAGGGAQEELVRGLLQQGALYLATHRYPAAMVALDRALAVDNVSLTRTQALIMLGQAYYESGRVDEAENVLLRALVNPETELFRRPNPLLPLGEGLAVLANVHRTRGEFEEARRIRRVQSRHLDGADERAEWAYQGILDGLAAGDRSARIDAWREASVSLEQTDRPVLKAMALLALCSAPGVSDSCPADGVAGAGGVVERAGSPRDRAGASLYLARNDVWRGRGQEARSRYEGLLREVHFLRSELPGVLGAWYWENRDALFAESLRTARSARSGHAEASLLVWARIRAIMQARPPARIHEELRAQFAGARADDGALQTIRAGFQARRAELTLGGLQEYLGRLKSDEVVLAIDLEHSNAHLWLASREGVASVQRALPDGFATALETVRRGTGVGSSVRLDDARALVGQALLGPLANRLPVNVFWLPSGRLLGMPLDELSLDGELLGRRHRVVGLAEFPGSTAPAQRLQVTTPGRVFLAGNPVDWTSRYPERLFATPEMTQVIERFVGPGLHVVQANALLPDEFTGPRLREADLLHLSMPALIDLLQPAASFLELSEPGREQGRARLAADQMRQWSLNAKLVVITQSSLLEGEAGRFDSRLGLVSDALEAGAGAVMVSGHAAGPAGGEWFARAFYEEWARSGSLGQAWRVLRAQQLSGASVVSEELIPFQLFIR